MMRATRSLVGALGLGLGLYGAVLMTDLGLQNFWDAAIWLVGGVLIHDAVLGPAVIVLAVAAARLLRRPVPGPFVVAGIVVGTVTIAVVPMLGRFGARADNPTLLPRDYVLGWIVFAGLTLLAATLAVVAGRFGVRARKGVGDGASAGR